VSAVAQIQVVTNASDDWTGEGGAEYDVFIMVDTDDSGTDGPTGDLPAGR
jgi:hypothetical protein